MMSSKDDLATTLDSETSTSVYLNVMISNEGGTNVRASLLQALTSVDISAVLFSTPEGTNINASKLQPLVNEIQTRDIAVMISDNFNDATEIDADGIHLPWRSSICADYMALRKTAGEAIMIGADAGKSRHDAMVLAEAGADYIAFGVPPHVKDKDAAVERQIELVAWWTPLFEVPVVAGDIEAPGQAERAKAAGADFVAVTFPPHSADQAQVKSWMDTFSALFPKPADDT